MIYVCIIMPRKVVIKIKTVYVSNMDSIIGNISIASTKNGVCAVRIDSEINKFYSWLNKHFDNIIDNYEYNSSAINQIQEYFKKKLFKFDLKLDIIGTDFRKKVWNEFLNVPYGKTQSYKDIAIKIGKPNACRAIGSAAKNNEIPIIIPCHRIIGKDNGLVGFTGGIDKKIKLLNLEGVNINKGKVAI